MNSGSKFDDKLANIFTSAFKLNAGIDRSTIVYGSTPGWDSLSHLTLVTAIEEEFDIMLDTDDVLDLSSYDKGLEILRKYKDEN